MKRQKLLSILLAFMLIGTGLTSAAAGAADSSVSPLSGNASDETELIKYQEYIGGDEAGSEYKNIPVDITAYSAGGEGFYISGQYGKKALVTPPAGEVSFGVTIPENGLYAVKIAYYPIENSGSEIVRQFKIDGKLPFFEASILKFPRIWADNVAEKLKDSLGNDLRPVQKEAPRFETAYLSSSSGLSTEKFFFRLTAGEHILSFSGVREPIAIGELSLETGVTTPSYDSYVSQKESEGLEVQSNSKIIEAEYASSKSDPMIYPLNDRTSPYTSPPSDYYIRYNTIGGEKWQTGGQWIEWEVEVPENGLYAVSLRYNQNKKNNSTVYRKLYIDGKVPFAEAENLAFPFTSGFTPMTLGQEGKPYYFHFTAGVKHKLRLEVVTGEFSEILENAQQLVGALNKVYREILMITGPAPDIYRDYDFPVLIPQTLNNMKALSGELSKLEELIRKISGYKSGSELAAVQRVRRCLEDMTSNDTTIAGRFKSFQDSISALAAWILETKNQPLEIDYFVIGGGKSEIKGHGGFFASAGFQLKQFICSFIMDYSHLGKVDDGEEETITVWLQTGRDQSQTIRGLISESFTPSFEIGVNLQLVAAGSLLPAIVAGLGPDIALQLPQSDPLNFAFRNAAQDLSGFKGFDKIRERFSDQAIVPFTYNGKVYALPESQSFQMMFYRKDILSELGIDKSKLDSWDSLYKAVIPELQKNYLSVGMQPVFNNYLMMLYQENGRVYNEAETKSLLNSEEAVKTFKLFTKFYTEYLQPVAFDFANQFRTGQMPLAIMDFTAYNQLSVYAPEIEGLWEMIPVPGTVTEDGKLRRGSVITLTASVMFSYSEKQKEAFDFLDWWTSAGTQNSYGKRLESILGTSARYNSANKEAFKNVAWDENIRAAIDEQSKSLYAVPEVPGGYFTTRHFDFSYRKAVIYLEEPRLVLNDAVKQINAEIRSKREEFKLD